MNTTTKTDLFIIDENYINPIIEEKTNNFIREWGSIENLETAETLEKYYFISVISFSDIFQKCESFRFENTDLYNIPNGWKLQRVETNYFNGFGLIKAKSSSV